MKLTSAYGGTEFGPPTYPTRRAPGENGWEYVSLSEDIQVNWEPQGDGTYECQFLVCLVHQRITHRILIANFRPIQTTRSQWRIWITRRDMPLQTSSCRTLLRQVSGRCTLFLDRQVKLSLTLIFFNSVGRKDDVIIHTSGEKTVPAPMENVIAHSP